MMHLIICGNSTTDKFLLLDRWLAAAIIGKAIVPLSAREVQLLDMDTAYDLLKQCKGGHNEPSYIHLVDCCYMFNEQEYQELKEAGKFISIYAIDPIEGFEDIESDMFCDHDKIIVDTTKHSLSLLALDKNYSNPDEDNDLVNIINHVRALDFDAQEHEYKYLFTAIQKSATVLSKALDKEPYSRGQSIINHLLYLFELDRKALHQFATSILGNPFFPEKITNEGGTNK